MILHARDPLSPGATRELERLCAAYWKPVYWLIRRRWNRPNEDAKDLTQQFFSIVLERDYLQAFSPDRGRFRTFLRTALENFLRNDARDRQRLKRGGGRRLVVPDGGADPIFDLPSADEPLEKAFDRLWARSLLQEALDLLRQQYSEAGREELFRIFEAHDLREGDPPGYPDLARRFQVTEDSVRHALRRVRADLRAFLRDRVRATVADPGEVEGEMRYLFGDAPGPEAR
jgi:RNA polymerase sigma-70 factor (ECF subfamily)